MKLTAVELEEAIEHMQAALAILRQHEGEQSPDPIWFLDTGQLSDKGINHLHSLFESGVSTCLASKEMGISPRAISLRHVAWKKRKTMKARKSGAGASSEAGAVDLVSKRSATRQDERPPLK